MLGTADPAFLNCGPEGGAPAQASLLVASPSRDAAALREPQRRRHLAQRELRRYGRHLPRRVGHRSTAVPLPWSWDAEELANHEERSIGTDVIGGAQGSPGEPNLVSRQHSRAL